MRHTPTNKQNRIIIMTFDSVTSLRASWTYHSLSSSRQRTNISHRLQLFHDNNVEIKGRDGGVCLTLANFSPFSSETTVFPSSTYDWRKSILLPHSIMGMGFCVLSCKETRLSATTRQPTSFPEERHPGNEVARQHEQTIN